MTCYKTIINNYPNARIAVVGDFMLDRYIWGNAGRISQEAPVPVVRVSRESEALGGAANVIRNITSLGGKAYAFGAVGNDTAGESLRQLLQKGGADINGVLATPDRPTTVKQRVVANNQQVVRIDNEVTEPYPEAILDQLQQRICEVIRNKEIDALIFEDYAKGLLTRTFMQNIADAARQNRVKTALDPHPGNPFKVQGLSLMTPNRPEAFGLAGIYYRSTVLPLEDDTPLLEVGNRIRSEWNMEYLLLTMGGDGMALFRPEEKTPLHIPTKAREVFDVSGAGDTVIATFMLSLAAGAGYAEAADISNHAAGVVVGKVGTAPIHLAELKQSMSEDGLMQDIG